VSAEWAVCGASARYIRVEQKCESSELMNGDDWAGCVGCFLCSLLSTVYLVHFTASCSSVLVKCFLIAFPGEI
jgi:hypothetical protein